MKKRNVITLLLMTALLLVGCSSPKTTETVAPKPDAVAWQIEGTDLMSGAAIDQSILQAADVTMVNFWATYCGPCLKEMPYLAELHKENANKGVQVLGVVTDILDGQSLVSNRQGASVADGRSIVTQSNVTYTNLLLNKTLADGIAKDLRYVPTTMFLDRNGRVIGEPINGAVSKADYQKHINDALKAVRNA